MSEIIRPDNSESVVQAAGTAQRKAEHIRICLEEEVQGIGITNGLDRYRFRHLALPELDCRAIDTRASFLGRAVKVPLLISSMTGGTDKGGAINQLLAEAAESRGWAMGLGSMRAAIENEALADSFRVRRSAPSIPVLANLGAAQLRLGYGVDQCRRAVELAEADGLVLHLNGLQEVFQAEGDTDWAGLLVRIEDLCRRLEVPVGVKEVGWGIDGDTAVRLTNAGAAFIDVAGAGGTSWSQVEKHRGHDPVRRIAAEAFVDWGNPTADCIVDVRARLPEAVIVASGGLRHGVDAAKAIALGANLAGYGRSLLAGAAEGDREQRSAAIDLQMERIEFELRGAMFGIGAGSIGSLRGTQRLVEAR